MKIDKNTIEAIMFVICLLLLVLIWAISRYEDVMAPFQK